MNQIAAASNPRTLTYLFGAAWRGGYRHKFATDVIGGIGGGM